MYPLNDLQLNLIRKEINRQDIHLGHLAEDLTDHICCEIEDRIARGSTFSEAFREVKRQIGLSGLQEIQNDTLFLTNTKYRRMKNSMKITGVAGMIMLAFGALLKILEYPGGNSLTLLGFILLGGVFFPVSMMVMRKESRQMQRPLVYISVLAGGMAVMFAIMFKVMHYPGFYVLISIGYGILGLVFLPLFMSNLIQNLNDKKLKSTYLIGTLSFFLCLLGGWTKFTHLPGALVFLISGTIGLTTVFFPLYVSQEFKGYHKVEPRFIFICVGLIYFNLFSLLLAVR